MSIGSTATAALMLTASRRLKGPSSPPRVPRTITVSSARSCASSAYRRLRSRSCARRPSMMTRRRLANDRRLTRRASTPSRPRRLLPPSPLFRAHECFAGAHECARGAPGSRRTLAQTMGWVALARTIELPARLRARHVENGVETFDRQITSPPTREDERTLLRRVVLRAATVETRAARSALRRRLRLCLLGWGRARAGGSALARPRPAVGSASVASCQTGARRRG
jgi:hypothetical protein